MHNSFFSLIIDKIIILVSKYLIDRRFNDPGVVTRILRQANINFAVLFETFKRVLNNRSVRRNSPGMW